MAQADGAGGGATDAMSRANAIAKASRRVEAASDVDIAQAGIEEYSAEGARYKLERLVGRGAYGAVYIATDLTDGKRVAIKHVVKAIKSDTDARRTYREMLVQAHFEHPNILALQHVLTPRDRAAFTSIFLVMEVMETDLHRVIHSRQDLTSDHISYFAYQLLCGLQHLHAAGVLHRDLKPSNLLVNSDCTLKLCDFGLARESDVSLSTALTEYVVTRWYRAPEVLLSGGRYSGAIDVWSCGCILAELLLRRPLFPGDNYLHQLQLVVEKIGSPSPEDLAFVSNPNAKAFMQRIPHSRGSTMQELFPHVRGPCLDLLRRMLVFHPDKRITIQEALEHPFLARVRSARSAVSELPLPPRFRMHPRLKALKAAEIRGLFVSRLCGSYTPDVEAPEGGLFPPAATAAVDRRRGLPSDGLTSSSSSAAAAADAPPASPPPRRPPPCMRDGMFVADGGDAYAAEDDASDGGGDDASDDDGFEDAQDMEPAPPGDPGSAEWLRDEGTAGGNSSSGGFVNAADADGADDGTPDPGYWTGDSSGQAGALAAELAEMSVGDASAAAAAPHGSSSSSSSSSSSALHAVVGRTQGTALVRLPAHAAAHAGASSSGTLPAASGSAAHGGPSGVLARRTGRRSHLVVGSGDADSEAFVSPAPRDASSGGFARAVSPILTPDDTQAPAAEPARAASRSAGPGRGRPAPAADAMDERLFAAAARGVTSSSSSSAAGSALGAPSRPLPAGAQPRHRVGPAAGGPAAARPLSRGGAAALAAATPPRSAIPAAPATASGGSARPGGLSVTPGSRRKAGAGPPTDVAGFSLARTGSASRERRARASLEMSGRPRGSQGAWQ